MVFFNESISFDSVFESLKFNEISNIILVSYMSSPNISSLLSIFNERKFLNTVLLDMSSSKLFSFQKFPTFEVMEIIEGTKLFESKVRDIRKTVVRLSCIRATPSCMKGSTKDGKDVYVGYMAHLITNFVRYIHGTLEITPFKKSTDEDLFMEQLINDEIDFHTKTRFLFSSDAMTQMENMQNMSYPLEFLQNLVTVPAPKHLDLKYYPIHPFDAAIWSCIELMSIYGSFLIYLGLKHKNLSSDFSYVWVNVIRAATGDSYPLHDKKNPKFVKISLILLNIMGFIITTLYSSFLGSFVTTTLREAPILSLDDIRKANLKIFLSKPYEYVLKKFHGIDEYMDLFELVETETYRNLRNNLSRKAYVEMSDRWNYHSLNRQKFYGSKPFHVLDRDLLSTYAFMNMNHDSFYKREFNKFILFSQSVGLYKHWGDIVFLETLIFNIIRNNVNELPKSKIKVLSMNFFAFVYFVWGIGLFMGVLVFSFEVIWYKLTTKNNHWRKSFFAK